VDDGRVGPGFKEPAREDAAVALGVIVFEAEKSYNTAIKQLGNMCEGVCGSFAV